MTTVIDNVATQSNVSSTINMEQQQQQQLPQNASAVAAAAANAAATNQTALYVGDLLQNVSEAFLFELFNAVGPVASVRVCRDLDTNFSLGYAYVNFNTHADAERALDALNFTPIKGRPCRIMWKQSDPSLRKTGQGNVFIKNLDPAIDHKALHDTFSLFGDILSCKVVTDRKTGESKGYGFVHFETVEAANEAIKQINGMLINGKEVYVGTFLKRAERVTNNAWTNIYIKNVPTHWDEDRLTQLVCECGEINSLVIMKENDVSKGFGFIDFVDHDGAANCIEKFNDYEVKTKEGEEAEKNGIVVPTNEPKKPEETSETTKPEDAEKKNEDSINELTSKVEGLSIDSSAASTAAAATTTKEGPIPEPVKLTQKLVVCRAQKKTERERELQGRFEKEKQQKANKYQGVNLYVKNLHESVDEDMLRSEFLPFGTITSARIMRDQSDTSKPATDDNGKSQLPSKGFGFVCLSSPEEATKAVTELNGKMIMGKPIYVALAQRKDARRMQLEAQHSRPGMGRGVMPMQNPGMYTGAQMYFPGGMPPQAAAGLRGNFGYMQQMMPRGMMQQQPGRQPNAMGMQGGYGRGVYPGMQGGYPQQMNGMGVQGVAPRGASRQRGGAGRQGGPGGMGGQQNIKYTAGARNQPGFGPGMGGMQMMPGVPMMPGGMQNGMMMPNMVPQQGNQQSMMGTGPEPLTAAALANASDEQQKNMIGEKLYPLIHAVQPELAGKITGMLLEMDNPELLHLIESPESLQSKITEALNVLDAHQSQKPDE